MAKIGKWRERAGLYLASGRAIFGAFLFPSRELKRLNERLSPRRRPEEAEILRCAARCFALLDRMGLRASCLTRSLALARLLREGGYEAQLVFGVRSDNGEMKGHCWVTVSGRPVESVLPGYQELEYE